MKASIVRWAVVFRGGLLLAPNVPGAAEPEWLQFCPLRVALADPSQPPLYSTRREAQRVLSAFRRALGRRPVGVLTRFEIHTQAEPVNCPVAAGLTRG